MEATKNSISDENTLRVSTGLSTLKQLNLGWILFHSPQSMEGTPIPATLPVKISKNLVLVHSSIFPQIVNSNLEVRTSVSINHETGAAEDGALFTYEAIPRETIFGQEIVEDCFMPKDGIFDVKTQWSRPNGATVPEAIEPPWTSPLDVAIAGLRLIDPLGVGGMGTRGFGRMKMVVPAAKGVV